MTQGNTNSKDLKSYEKGSGKTLIDTTGKLTYEIFIVPKLMPDVLQIILNLGFNIIIVHDGKKLSLHSSFSRKSLSNSIVIIYVFPEAIYQLLQMLSEEILNVHLEAVLIYKNGAAWRILFYIYKNGAALGFLFSLLRIGNLKQSILYKYMYEHLHGTKPNLNLKDLLLRNKDKGDFGFYLHLKVADEKAQYENTKTGSDGHESVKTADQSDILSQTSPPYSGPVAKRKSGEELSFAVVVPDEMQKIRERVGKLSYYYSAGRRKLVVHTESAESTSKAYLLRTLLKDLLEKYNLGSSIQLEVIQSSAGACLAYNWQIGSRILIGMQPPAGSEESLQRKQAVGLYLVYDVVVYWVSTAHGLEQALPPTEHFCAESYVDAMHRGDEHLHLGFPAAGPELLRTPASPQPQQITRASPPYVCYAYGFPTQPNGEKLNHSIDIMMGPLSLTIHQLDQRFDAQKLRAAGTRCGHSRCYLESCNHIGERTECLVSGVHQLQKSSLLRNGVTFVYFDTNEIMHKTVYCRLDVKHSSGLTRGRVSHAPDGNDSNSYQVDMGNQTYQAENVIVIDKFQDGAIYPKRGHSGCVWLLETEQGYEAVAITIAVRPRICWLAVPMCASLFALQMKYPKVFKDYRHFLSVQNGLN